MLRTITAALLVSSALAGAAVAQTTTATTPGSPATPTMSATAPTQFMTDQRTGDFRASKFVGVDIYGSEGQKVGDINELLVDGSGRVTAAVIGVGGFLGIGEKNVAVPFSSITWANTRPATAAANTSPPTTVTPPVMGTIAPRGDTTGSTAPAASPTDTAAYNGYPDHGTVQLTKAQLQNAPAFRYFSETHSANGAPSK